MHRILLAAVGGMAVIGSITTVVGAPAAEEVAVKSSNSDIDFDTQIMPIFTQAGCNGGSCHGAAAGRGGFRLSLLGATPADDFQSIVRELGGRRVNLAHAERSLLLRKPTEDLDHEGGYKIRRGSEAEKLIRQWIEQGARRTQRRTLKEFSVAPAAYQAAAVGTTVDLRAAAWFDRGQEVDVTPWAVWTSMDDAAVMVEKDGKAKILRRGEHVVLVRFLDQVRAVTLSVPMQDEAVELSWGRAENPIDRHVLRKLEWMHLRPGPRTEDAAFLRRITLDLAGRLPSEQEIGAFATDGAEDKRASVIDRLLNSEEFADLQAMRLAEHFQLDSKRLGEPAARAMHAWLRQQAARNTPLDAMAKQMLTASGDATVQAAANYSRIPMDARDQAEYIGRTLMGVRIACANCHNHPLDRWTQDDYHGFAAAFAKLDRGPVVRVMARGEVTHPVTGQPAEPRIPGQGLIMGHGVEGDPRQAVAEWLTQPDNPYFAAAAVNRMWKRLMGRGLVEPVDDLRATNPATHPELLAELSQRFIDSGYDVRAMLRLIAMSDAYQRSSEPVTSQPRDDRFYSVALVKPLPAQVLADIISQATDVADSFAGYPAGTRAVQLIDARVPSRSLDILGRCSRELACDSSSESSGLTRTLHLLNGPILNARITDANGWLHRQIAAGGGGRELIDAMYLRTFSRLPTDVERTHWMRQTKDGKDVEALQDMFWAMMSHPEFSVNH